jgi:uncharacterized membrane protein
MLRIIHEAEAAITLTLDAFSLLFDIICAVFIVAGACIALYKLFKHKHHLVLTMARYINAALLFKLSGEVIRLICVRTLKEVLIIACIVAIHGAISFLISWEVKREEKRDISPDKQKEIGEDIFL